MKPSVQCRIPGKLYLAGEYAILQPQQAAILMAVDAYIETTFQSNTRYHLFSEGVQPNRIDTSDLNTITDRDWQLVVSAIKTVETLTETTLPFKLTIKSQMQNESGLKFGFGSSGAVTAAVIQGLYFFFTGVTGDALSPLQLYKATVLAQVSIGASGSFGDVACSCYGGLVYYRAPDFDWIDQQLKEKPLKDIIEADWPHLVINPIETDPDYSILIGWTGTPASTQLKISNLSEKVAEYSESYQKFLAKTRPTVDQLKDGLTEETPDKVHQALADYRDLLAKFDTNYQIGIITPTLQQFIDLAQQAGYTGKSSGAGGGDCGIAFNHHDKNKQMVYQLWQQAGIQPIDLTMGYPELTHPERT